MTKRLAVSSKLSSIIGIVLLSAGAAWAQEKAPEKTKEKTYVGEETCAQCHDVQAQWSAGSLHEKFTLKTPSGREVQGCEICHGPGSAHVDDLDPASIVSLTKEPAAQRSAVCLACHKEAFPELNYRRSIHLRRGVACTDCHAVKGSESFHKMRTVGDLMDGVQPKLCYQCHSDQRGAFALPYHHPVDEKFMDCSTCHDPHGTYTVTQLKKRHADEVCVKCHEDAAGPFIFEHPAGRASECTVCHQPHGSPNPRLLNRVQVRYLCLECHTDTPVFHDLSQTKYQNCTACHSRVHGSNLDRKLFE